MKILITTITIVSLFFGIFGHTARATSQGYYTLNWGQVSVAEDATSSVNDVYYTLVWGQVAGVDQIAIDTPVSSSTTPAFIIFYPF